MKRKLIFTIFLLILLVGCAKTSEPTNVPTVTAAPTATSTPTVMPTSTPTPTNTSTPTPTEKPIESWADLRSYVDDDHGMIRAELRDDLKA